jgi:hypothetical protein
MMTTIAADCFLRQESLEGTNHQNISVTVDVVTVVLDETKDDKPVGQTVI